MTVSPFILIWFAAVPLVTTKRRVSARVVG
jgi:hypothetical protein